MSNSGMRDGFSLVEAVVFIVVLSLGFTGILIIYNRVTTAAVDPLVRVQALAIASSLLEEIELKGFTYCDPDDPNVFTATSTAGCTAVEGAGPETGETRYASPQFDNVNDYNGFTMAGGIRDITNTSVSGLGSYQVTSVTISNVALSDVTSAADSLQITVTVAGPGGVNVTLQGYRLRYAPNSP